MSREAVRKLVDRFNGALVNGNLTELMSCYDDHVVFQMPGVPVIIGKPGVQEHYRNVLAMNVSAVRMNADSYAERLDCDIEAGTYEMTINPPGSAPITDKGKYLIVCRENGGQWRIWYDMVLSDSSATVASL